MSDYINNKDQIDNNKIKLTNMSQYLAPTHCYDNRNRKRITVRKWSSFGG